MNGFDLSQVQDIRLGSTTVSAVYLGSTKIWPAGHDYSRDYLTVTALENHVAIQMTKVELSQVTGDSDIQYSLDNGLTWNIVPYTSTKYGSDYPWKFSQQLVLNNGQSAIFRKFPNNLNIWDDEYFNFSNTYNFTERYNGGRVSISGNIMSILHGDNSFINDTTLPSGANPLSNMFYKCEGLYDASNLVLPATTINSYNISTGGTGYNGAYSNMFHGCTSLVLPPKILPATTLTPYCYWHMFDGCTSLTTAPELPAIILAECCYETMFHGCTALTTAPELPATTLTVDCYFSMFSGCTNLNYVKCLATDISAQTCTNNWLKNVSATGTFVKASSMNNWTIGVSGIPNGWTIQNA